MNLVSTQLSRSPALRLIAAVLVIFVVVLLSYLPALHGQFVWDDALLVQKNPLVKGDFKFSSIWFRTDFPLTLTALWLQWLAWGNSAAGYHIVNVLLHATGAVLLWRVLAKLNISGALLGALIFAVHPVCAGSVAWISEMKNTLSLVFYLLSLLAYLHSEQPPASEASLRRWWQWLSLTAFVLALLSKTSTVMLPLALLLCAWWQRGRVTSRDVLRTSPYFVASLGFGLMTIWFQGHQAMTAGPVQTESFLARLAGGAKAVWFYLGKDFLPLNLSMIYPRWTIDPGRLISYVPLLALVALFGLCWRFRHGWGRPLLFALAYFTVTLFPVLGFFDMYFLTLSRVSDHLQYLALMSIAALAGAGLTVFSRKNVMVIPGAILVILFSILTFRRAGIISDGEKLWRDTVAKNPAAWTAHNNLGCILAEQQKYDEAMTHFVASLDSNPRNVPAHSNLGKAFAVKGDFARAEEQFRTALSIKPDDADAQRSFGSALADEGKIEEATQHLQEALRIEPEVPTRLQLAGLLRQGGKYREAVAQYRQALLAKPDSLEALNNLAWLLATCSDDSVRNGPQAVQAGERACRLTGYKEIVPLGTLAAAYAEASRFDDAVATAEKSLALATATGQQQFAALNQQLLAYYRAGKPWHERPGGK